MKQEKDFIEVPFGARDSELGGFEYTIPQGYEAEIKDGKVIVRKAESEDEKIRKALLTIVKKTESSLTMLYGVDKADLIAWLEKCAPKTHNDVGQYIKLNSEQYSFMIPSDLYPRLDGYNQQLWRNEIEYAYSNGRTDERNKQKPTEWSEEDLQMLQDVISGLEATKQLTYAHEPQGKAQMQERIDWLKSLRPQNRWKPSDEQINALDSTLQYNQVSHNSFEYLNSLFNDLKKLREE